MTEQLGTLDWLVVAAYFGLILGVAWWSAAGKKSTHESSTGYFLAGRNVGWFVVGAALFASNIGSEHLVGLAGTGFGSGVAVAQFELLASLILLLLGWVFVPFYISSGVFTMPEFLERRYSSGARWYLAVVSIIGYVLTKISVTLYAGGIVFEVLVGGGFWTGAILIVLLTGAYTVLGGLRAVLYTEAIQTVLLILGALLVTILGIVKLGGISALRTSVDPSFWEMWHPSSHPSFPWTGILFGAPILGVWYWCTDQFIVQRVLSAHGIEQARRGTIFAGFLKILPLFLFVVPGVIALALTQKGVLNITNPDHALPEMIRSLLPAGIRGLVVAGFLAALMSSLAAVFNSCSTLITLDVYRPLRPNASEKSLVLVGKVSTLFLVVLGLAWIPFMKFISGQIYVYLQSVQAYIAPPIAAVFLIGLCWRRANAKGAMASLLTGFVLGTLRLVLELRGVALNGIMDSFVSINFLHFALLLFVICSLVLVVVSLMTQPLPAAQLEGLTFATTLGSRSASEEHSRKRDLLWTGLLIAAVIVVWVLFR